METFSWPFVGETTGHRWISLTKASDVELWYFFFICAWTNDWDAIEMPVIWDAIAIIMTSL